MSNAYYIRYEWRILSRDGLLKEVPIVDNRTKYYNMRDKQFENRAEAEKALEEYLQEVGSYAEDNFVLIKLYRTA